MLLGDLPQLVNWLVLTLGAAMVLGTGAALLRFRRTGVFPGQAPDEPPRRHALRGALVKLAIGVLLVLWGLAGLVLPE